MIGFSFRSFVFQGFWGVLFFSFAPTAYTQQEDTPNNRGSYYELFRSYISDTAQRLDDLENRIRYIEDSHFILANGVSDSQYRSAEIFQKIIERMNETDDSVTKLIEERPPSLESRVEKMLEGPVCQGEVSLKDKYLDVVDDKSEMKVFVTPGEPTAITFDEVILGGWMRKGTRLSIDRREKTLIVITTSKLGEKGEAILTMLQSGTLVGARIFNADESHPRNVNVQVNVSRAN